MNETKWIFFSFFSPVPSFLTPDIPGVQSVNPSKGRRRGWGGKTGGGEVAAIVFLDTSRGSSERLIRFDERRVHA